MKPRIIRKSKPKRKFSENTYRKALSLLLDDFERRCAYSLQHVEKVGWKVMEVDHFDPTLKGAKRNRYENLFPATRHCNGSKSNVWPSIRARLAGIRFLNPCVEPDYGFHIFEDLTTHLLVGVTEAGRYHIRVLGLNAPFLVNERTERASLSRLLDNTTVTISNSELAIELLTEVRKLVSRMIPAIPPPPTI